MGRNRTFQWMVIIITSLIAPTRSRTMRKLNSYGKDTPVGKESRAGTWWRTSDTAAWRLLRRSRAVRLSEHSELYTNLLGALLPGSLTWTQAGRELTAGLVQRPPFYKQGRTSEFPSGNGFGGEKELAEQGQNHILPPLGYYLSHSVSCHLPFRL